VEEELKVALLGNRFADFEQGLELPHWLREGRRRGDFGSCVWQPRHEDENSIGFGGLTTDCGVCAKRAVFVYFRSCRREIFSDRPDLRRDGKKNSDEGSKIF
jgi:hypothetical protein